MEEKNLALAALERLERNEARIVALEADRDRFLKALRGAVEMLLENPMATAMMPKQMKEDLRRYIKEPS